MTEKWLIVPGDERVIDIDTVTTLKVGLVGGQLDIVAHDEPGIRIEVHGVTVKDLRIEAHDGSVEIDHPQLGWENFLEVFRNFGSGGPKADVSIAVPRTIALNLGVVSAGALVSGLVNDARLNTVSGDIIVDTLTGNLTVNSVSGDVQVRGLSGSITANSVSGDIAVTGTLRRATVDTVAGSILVDAAGDVSTVNLNSVSGGATVRLDDSLAANYVIRSLSGKLLIDGEERNSSVTGAYTGSRGDLAGTFVDVKANSVSGGVTVLRRTPAPVADDMGRHE